jgi:citrate lyase subunit beta / citryl-CoA lyase
MRAILILPAGAGRLPMEALTSGASALLLRLGPGGDDAARAGARAYARACLETARGRAERPAIFAQIAPGPSAGSEADLDAVLQPGLDGVFLEACEGRADVQQLAARLTAREAALGLPEGGVEIVALAAQTPAGVFALGGYRDASPRLAALAMDETALPGGAAARGVARTLLALGAAAAGVAAYDIAPYGRGGALEEACRLAGREGFSGLMTPRAGEIPVIARAAP